MNLSDTPYWGLILSASVDTQSDLQALRDLGVAAGVGGVLAHTGQWMDPVAPTPLNEPETWLVDDLSSALADNPGALYCPDPQDLPELVVQNPDINTFIVQVSLTDDGASVRELWAPILAISVGHVGINVDSLSDSQHLTATLAHTFGMPIRETPMAYFIGTLAEVLKGPFLGEKGHVAIDTPRIEVTELFLRRQGLPMREDTRALDDQGRLQLIYMAEDWGGFAWHLRAVRG